MLFLQIHRKRDQNVRSPFHFRLKITPYMATITQVLYNPDHNPKKSDSLNIEISFTNEDLHHQFYLEISRKHAIENGELTDHFHDMVPVVAESGSQIVKYEIRKIGKRSDHREEVKFIVRIFSLVGRAESKKYEIR